MPAGFFYALATRSRFFLYSFQTPSLPDFGVIRGRLRFWLSYGVAIDVAVMGAILLSFLIGAGYPSALDDANQHEEESRGRRRLA
jgi:hypothetical protein